jgi:hypothetical protein
MTIGFDWSWGVCRLTTARRQRMVTSALACGVLSFGLADGSPSCWAESGVPTSASNTTQQDKQTSAADLSADLKQKRWQSVGKALPFLDSQQAPDGSFSGHAGTGPTSLVLAAMLENGRDANHPTVAKAIEYLRKHVRPDGGIYSEGSIHRNYETALAMMALSAVNQGQTYAKEIEGGAAMLRKIQWGMAEGKDSADMAYGGAGYGSHGRPDLSNTSFMIDALKAAGATEDDPAIQAALEFVTRCQNHESEFNKAEFATQGSKDGGFFYTAAAGGESKAVGDGPGLRSYGSMTYAGLKSMLYAGVDKDDTRVQAAVSYLRKNYDLKSNPGVGAQGLYYYYQVFGKAFNALGEPTFTDADGVVHDWRADLISELAARQQDNGSWYNVESERWMEGDAVLVTAYALLALSHTE